MIRVVLDTNVLVRASIPSSPVAEIVRLLSPPTAQLVLSEELLEEVAEVMRYPRVQAIHRLDSAEIQLFLALLRAWALVVHLPHLPDIVHHDQDDNIVTATALFGHAHFVCSLDRHLWHKPVRQHLKSFSIRMVREEHLLRYLRRRRRRFLPG